MIEASVYMKLFKDFKRIFNLNLNEYLEQDGACVRLDYWKFVEFIDRQHPPEEQDKRK